MKNDIHPSSRSEARGGNARSITRHRSGAWLGLLLAWFCTLLTGLAHPAQAAVIESWVQRYNSPAKLQDTATAVAVDGSGNVVVTGSSWNGTNNDYYTAKYAAADGALLWEKRGPIRVGSSMSVDGSGNVVVTGTSRGDFYTTKYAAANGGLLWEKRSPMNSLEYAEAVAVDSSGNVVVTGYSYTAKYAAADGALLWEQRYNGPTNRDDRMSSSHSLALGANGMVAITGTSDGDYATVVYREVLPPISIALVPTGVGLRFTGTTDLSYTIQRAPGVTGPWTIINTQTAPASGLLEYLHAPAPASQAFYRTVQP